ncbi:MAG: hypothetical protein LRY48_03590 [Bacteroides graminisolvens]|nr:hypothetical protein [Bacteroides graminisolvens]
MEDLSKDGNMQQSVFGVYLGGAEEKNKYNAGYLAPTVHLHNLFTKGDKRYEGTFMLELHKFYYDYYTAPTTLPLSISMLPAGCRMLTSLLGRTKIRLCARMRLSSK